MQRNATKVIIIGLGAQAKYVIETISYYREYIISGVFSIDDDPAHRDGSMFGSVKILGDLSNLEAFVKLNHIGSAMVCCASNLRKKTLSQRASKLGLDLVNALHPSAIIARTAILGKGIIINAGAVIQPYAKIGNGVMIHANTTIEHDCRIGDYANIAPGATLAGWVEVGPCACIYTNATIVPKIKIGDGAIVGAGATVLADVPPGETVAGNPARPIRKSPK